MRSTSHQQLVARIEHSEIRVSRSTLAEHLACQVNPPCPPDFAFLNPGYDCQIQSASMSSSRQQAAEPARIEAIEVAGHRNDVGAALCRNTGRELAREALLLLLVGERLGRASLRGRHQ